MSSILRRLQAQILVYTSWRATWCVLGLYFSCLAIVTLYPCPRRDSLPDSDTIFARSFRSLFVDEQGRLGEPRPVDNEIVAIDVMDQELFLPTSPLRDPTLFPKLRAISIRGPLPSDMKWPAHDAVRRAYVDHDQLPVAHQRFPDRTIRSARVSRFEMFRLLFLLAAGVLPIGLMMVINTHHFAAMNIVSYPRASEASHLLSRIMFAGVAVIQIAAFRYLEYGWPIAITLGLYGAVPAAVFILIERLSRRVGGFCEASWGVLLAFLQLIFSLVIVMNELTVREFDFLFTTAPVGVCVALSICFCGAGVVVESYFHELAGRLAEYTAAPIRFAPWDAKALASWQAPAAQTASLPPRWLWETAFEDGLEAVAVTSSTTKQVSFSKLWQLGQPVSAWRFSVYFGLATSAVLSVLLSGFWVYSLVFPGKQLASEEIMASYLLVVMIGGMMSWAVPLILMNERQPYLSRHLLMSSSRREWIWKLCLETAKDFLPACCATVIGLICYPWLANPNMLGIGAMAPLVLSVLVVLYAWTLWWPTVPPTTILAVALVPLTGTLLLITLWVLVPDTMHQLGNELASIKWLRHPATWIAVLLLTGLGLARNAYHRWLRREFA